MPSVDIKPFTPKSIKIYLLCESAILEPETWTYLPFNVASVIDPYGLYTLPASNQNIFDFDITNFIKDPDWDWYLEILPSYASWEFNPLGDRAVSFDLLLYETVSPREEWDTEFGKYKDNLEALVKTFGRAAASDYTYFPLLREARSLQVGRLRQLQEFLPNAKSNP